MRVVPAIEHPAVFTAVEETENAAVFVPPLAVNAAEGLWALYVVAVDVTTKVGVARLMVTVVIGELNDPCVAVTTQVPTEE